MASKYGTIKITDEELRVLITCVDKRRKNLAKTLEELYENGHEPNTVEVKEATEAFHKTRAISLKLTTLRRNAKLD